MTDLTDAELMAMDALLLDKSRRILSLPAIHLARLDPEKLKVWCHRRARYGLVTSELVVWLREQIAGRSALEIGAGMGDLGYHLHIRMTDDHQQTNNSVVASYIRSTQQIPTIPPPDVITRDAEMAVLKYKPQVVIGSWITQRHLPGEDEGNMFGPREENILVNCETYIHIGNENIHGTKRILKFQHTVYRFPWLYSRAADQTKNIIYIWNNSTPPKPTK